MSRAAPAAAASEAALATHWAAAPHGPLRLADGRPLWIIHPGTPGGGPGPDFRDAILDAGGDLLRGDVELHLRASGWRAHGHHRDPAYATVVLHVVGENDTGALATLHGGARAVPILVLGPAHAAGPTPFAPPCSSDPAALNPGPTLARLGLRRLRSKAARVQPLVAAAGPGQAFWTLVLETLAGAANRAAFAALARGLPLTIALEAMDAHPADRALAASAALRAAAGVLVLRRAGLRPLAAPAARLTAAGALAARLWPAGTGPGWPALLAPGVSHQVLAVPGLGRGTAIELAVNAVLPVALASGEWPEQAVRDAFSALPSPGTYGRLRPLERWLSRGGRPFPSAATLQGGLQLQRDYCAAGRCGRCPFSGSP
jgi:hypothetical protein